MALEERAHADLAAKIELILRHHIDSSCLQRDIRFWTLVLDGGRIPADVSEALRPVLSKLAATEPGAIVRLSKLELDLFDWCYSDTMRLGDKRREAQKILERRITENPWLAMEETLANKFGLKLLPLNARTLELWVREVEASDFSVEQISAAVESEHDMLTTFCEFWHAHLAKQDYGEEWDPDEGNQQEGGMQRTILGMAQGFIVCYSIPYLYASHNPESLLKFLKLRRKPHAKKFASDVMRVYQKTSGPKR